MRGCVRYRAEWSATQVKGERIASHRSGRRREAEAKHGTQRRVSERRNVRGDYAWKVPGTGRSARIDD
jgi:hypothetical protein